MLAQSFFFRHVSSTPHRESILIIELEKLQIKSTFYVEKLFHKYFTFFVVVFDLQPFLA